MARFEITVPGRGRFEVTAPESMSEADALAEFQRQTGMAPSGGPKQLSDVRREYPQYNDLSDQQLADRLHERYYSDMPRADFDQRIGLQRQSWGAYAGGLARQAAQGLSFGFADEAEAGLRSAFGGGSYGDIVSGIRQQNERFAQDSPIASATANIAGGVAPFLAGPGAALARLAVGRTMGSTVARSAGVGAGAGAVSGFGAGEGGVGELLPSALTGAGVGAGLGAAAPPVLAALAPVARGVGGVVSPMLERFRAPGARPEPPVPPVSGHAPPIEGATFVDDIAPQALTAQDRALQLMADQLTRAGRSVQSVEEQLAQAARARRYHSSGVAPDATALVDLEPSWQRLAGAAWRGYPEAAGDASRFMSARQTGITPPGADAQALATRGLPTGERFAPPMTGAEAERTLGAGFSTPKQGIVPMGHVARVRDALRRAFRISDADYHGHTRTGLRTVEAVVRRAEEAAKESYAKAYAAHEALDLRSPVLSVFQRHIERAALEQSPNIERHLMKLQNDLFLRPRRSIVLRQFDNSKRQLDNLIADDLAKPKYAHRGAILTQLKDDLLAAVDTATGGEASLYRAARQEFSDSMSMARAYQLGRRSLDDRQALRRTGPLNELQAGAEVTADAFRALTPGQQKLARFGMLDAVTAQAMRKPKEREALAIFSTPRVQELLGAAIPRTATPTGRARAGAVFADRPQRFGRFLANERAMLDTRDVVRGNSMTARNLQDDQMLATSEAVQSVSGFMDILRGSTSLWNAGQQFLERALDRSFGISADAAAELSRMLFTANPQERAAILQRLAAIMPPDRMTRFNELMRQVARFGVAPGAGAFGGAMGAPQGPVGL